MLDTAKGTRDFTPEEKILRDYIMDMIRAGCQTYGFNPIETPIIERYETLAAKFAAGEESDALKEIFTLKDQGGRSLGLRFDLTVPFSRYVAMNRDIKMPFKKYMTGEVFRDGPIKKGRYRQFTQFDADIVGSDSMLADAEILALADHVFGKLGRQFVIEVNSRKILQGVMQDFEIEDTSSAIISIDKLKKIGPDGVVEELVKKGFDKKKVGKMLDVLSPKSDSRKTLEGLNLKSQLGKEGLKEMEKLLGHLEDYGVSVVFDPTLARGLAYYTGPIYEVFLKDSDITSSVAAGGRYDDLIGNYLGTEEKIPATGISFGVDVLMEAMRSSMESQSVTDIFVIPIKAKKEAIGIVQQIREKGICADVDLMDRGISANLQFADSYSIPYVLFVGKRELEQGKVKLRDMKTGDEEMLTVENVVDTLQNGLQS